MRYRCIFLLFLLSTLPLSAIPTSPWNNIRSKHSWKSIPNNWESLGPPPADAAIYLYIALKPHRENALVDALDEVSDLNHPRHVSPTILSLPIISRVPLLRYCPTRPFLARAPPHNFILGLSDTWRQFLDRSLGVCFQSQQPPWGVIPVFWVVHVQTVAPTTFFSSQVTKSQTPRKSSNVAAVWPGQSPSRRDDADITPAFLRWLYSTFAYVPSAVDRNVVGVTGYNQEYPSPADLTSYMLKYRPDGIDATYVVESVNGDEYNPNNPGGEANVNIQLSEGMTYPTPHIFYSTKKSRNNDVFLAWLDAVLSKQNIPQTITTSYGTFEKAFPRDYAIQVCNLFAQLGARGVSVLFASGDHGVGSGDCTTRFTPIFPATCRSPHSRIFAGPYVTAVGGTSSFTPEVAASLSGGGFSEYFPRPSYQQQAVSTFLGNLGHQYSGLYNPDGRGIPDIAAQAMKIRFFYKGEELLAEGTSCSAPIVAGVISLLNDYRLSQGRPPLGFLNPWLYGGGLNGLNDIVSGSNPGCDTNGFPAIVGWDPVTGLGTPDFLRLMALMDTLDPGSSNPPE
ncbi:subtilisin-like protein [Lactarius vividus]|nr:subtilisin-like protein [Lactarius vividus]